MLPKVNLIRGNGSDYLLFSNNDLISETLYKKGVWENHLLQISKLFYLNDNEPFVMDIGANLGAFIVPIAKDILSQNGTAFAFEPQRIVYYQLCGNLIINGLDNVFSYNCAVGDYDGEIDIPNLDYSKSDNIGALSIDRKYNSKDNEGLLSTSTLTPIITLNSLKVPKSPSLIKLDVEGFELNVLKGGDKFLEDCNYPPILFEAWGADWFLEEKTELMSFLTYLGYTITQIGNKDDYVAQHKRNDKYVEFIVDKNGTLTISRVR